MRDTFLAILGHDLRSPLSTITMAGDYLTKPPTATDATSRIGLRVKRSAATMTAMVNDLLEYARTQLSGAIPITRTRVDVSDLCQSAIDDASAAHPNCAFELVASGDSVGNFDGTRLHQVFSNLLINAARYRDKEHPVTVSIIGETDSIMVEVKNFGPVIPPDSLEIVFDRLVQLGGTGPASSRPSTSLGLGLFIAREITEAHDGAISVTSDEASGTIFSVRLPRATLDQPIHKGALV